MRFFLNYVSGLPKQIRNDKPKPVRRTNEKWSNENDAQKNVKENLRAGSQQLLGRDDEHRRRPSGPGDRHRLDVRVVGVAVGGDGEEEAPSFDEPPFECRRPASEKSMYINKLYLLCSMQPHKSFIVYYIRPIVLMHSKSTGIHRGVELGHECHLVALHLYFHALDLLK